MPAPGRPATPHVVAVVPARAASTRLPNKALLDLAGIPMVRRVLDRAAAARVSEVVLATDDPEIARAAGPHRVVMTPADCDSGTDRVARALASLEGSIDLVVNVQGDLPLVDPAAIDELVRSTLAAGAGFATLARPLDPARLTDPSSVKVLTDQSAPPRALYFSRAPIPHGAPELAQLHVGLYAYRPSVLRELASRAPGPLERAERLEQLRALEHGVPITVFTTDRDVGPSIDVPGDVSTVLTRLSR